MKKFLFVFMSVLLIAGLLSGCAPTEPVTPDEPEPVVEEPAVEEPAVEEPAVEEPAVEEPVVEEPAVAESVEIEFWYVPFTNWDDAMTALIDEFEAKNPDIRVIGTGVPYAEFNERVAAMVPVGQGPDVVTPYHGWVPIYHKSGFLAPIPESVLPASELKEILIDAADVLVFDGEYYGVPFYIMNYAVFYNKDYFEQANLDTLPRTWEELREHAIQCTQYDENGNIQVNGYYQHFPQQDHIIWKNLLIQWGQPLSTPDYRTTLWTETEKGYEAWEWFVGLTINDEVSEPYFNESAYAAFYTGQACMIIAGPQVLGQIYSQAPDLNFGTTRMVVGPAENEEAANFNVAQYWNFSITAKASNDPAKYEASARFLEFLTTEEAVKIYTNITGALPPLRSLMEDPLYTEDEHLKPFIETLGYSQALFWVDEKEERQLCMDMADRIFLAGDDPREVFDWGAAEQQKLVDRYFDQ